MMQPRYPLYIPSKGRWIHGLRLTSRALEEMHIPYRIVVEEQQYPDYVTVIDPTKILVLDPAYQRDYDTCDDLGDSKSKGSGPARNFIWDHATATGAAYHWIMDDNIQRFYRLNHNTIIQVLDGVFFRCMEEFVERYENVAMAGPQYEMFAPRKSATLSPFTLNTRIYSCNLIRNDVPFRWRGRFNEDTILSLDLLKAGYCTVLFTAFLQKKRWTQEKRGGNTDELYRDGTLDKSRMLVKMHPDVSRLVWKFGRWHHHVDYRPFKANRLRKKPGIVIPEGVNEYGMRLVHLPTSALPMQAAD